MKVKATQVIKELMLALILHGGSMRSIEFFALKRELGIHIMSMSSFGYVEEAEDDETVHITPKGIALVEES